MNQVAQSMFVNPWTLYLHHRVEIIFSRALWKCGCNLNWILHRAVRFFCESGRNMCRRKPSTSPSTSECGAQYGTSEDIYCTLHDILHIPLYTKDSFSLLTYARCSNASGCMPSKDWTMFVLYRRDPEQAGISLLKLNPCFFYGYLLNRSLMKARLSGRPTNSDAGLQYPHSSTYWSSHTEN